MKKFLLLTSVLILVVAVSLVLFVKFYLTPERVREFVIPAVEKSLNRQVEAGEISINIFKGIGLKDFVIKESDGKSEFIQCDDFVLRFKLIPLLSKNVIIDELTVVSPEISIFRKRDGTFNFEDIGKKQASKEPKEEKKKEEQAEKPETAGLPVSLLVSEVNIDKAVLTFTDLLKEMPDVKSSADINFSIESLEGSELTTKGSINIKLNELLLREPSEKMIRDINAALEYAVKVDVESYAVSIDRADFKLQKIPVSVEGTVKNIQTAPDTDLVLSLPDTDISRILKLASQFADLRGIDLSGKIKADIRLKGRPDNIETLTTNNNIRLKGIAFTYEKLSSAVEGDLRFSTDSDNVQIEKADFKLQGIPVSLKGAVNNLTTSPEMDMSVSVPEADSAKLMKLATPFADLKDLAVSGILSLNADVKGKPDNPDTLKASGSIDMKNINIDYADINAIIDGGIQFSENVMDFDMTGTIGRNTAEAKGTIKNYLKDQDININIYSKKIYVDELMPPVPVESGKTPPSPGKTGPAQKQSPKEAEPLELELAAQGEIKVDSAEFKGFDVSNVHMLFSLKNNKLDIRKLTANAGKGAFSLKSNLDLSRPGYGYNLSGSLDSLHADEVVNAMYPDAKDTVFGILSAGLSLKGAGTLPDNIKKNLTGEGKFDLKDGKITNAPIVRKLSSFLNIRELQVIGIQKAEGNINIKNSKARLNSSFTGDDLTMDPHGTIGLDQSLDLEFDLKLSPRLTDKLMKNSGIAKYISDEKGRGVIPLKVTGSFSDPSYKVDVEKAGKRAIEKEADRLIDRIFKKDGKKSTPDKAAPSDEQQPVKKPEEQIKDLLKDLF